MAGTQNWGSPAGTEPLGVAILTHLVDRTDALRAHFSGATAPTVTVAYMFWADTTTGMMRMRNAANNAWIDVCPLHAQAKQLQVVRASGALDAEELQTVVPANATVERLVLVPDTATTGSVASTTEWGFMLRNVTQGLDLFSATPTTASNQVGIGGGAELVADAPYSLTTNQNAAASALDVLRLTITKTGTPTAVPDVSIALVLSMRGV